MKGYFAYQTCRAGCFVDEYPNLFFKRVPYLNFLWQGQDSDLRPLDYESRNAHVS